jgi:hypothetical protein
VEERLMPALAIGVIWLGYSITLWGYCLVRGYNVTFTELVNPVHPVDWKTATGSTVPQGQILPGAAADAGANATAAPPSTATGPPPTAV